MEGPWEEVGEEELVVGKQRRKAASSAPERLATELSLGAATDELAFPAPSFSFSGSAETHLLQCVHPGNWSSLRRTLATHG